MRLGVTNADFRQTTVTRILPSSIWTEISLSLYDNPTHNYTGTYNYPHMWHNKKYVFAHSWFEPFIWAITAVASLTQTASRDRVWPSCSRTFRNLSVAHPNPGSSIYAYSIIIWISSIVTESPRILAAFLLKIWSCKNKLITFIAHWKSNQYFWADHVEHSVIRWIWKKKNAEVDTSTHWGCTN